MGRNRLVLLVPCHRIVAAASPVIEMLEVSLAMMAKLLDAVEPKLFGKELNLSAVVVLLSLVYWGWVWGVFGMFIAVPATSALKIIFEHFDGTRPLSVLMSDYRGEPKKSTRSRGRKAVSGKNSC